MPAPVPSGITVWHWIGFIAATVALLAFDLSLFHRSPRLPTAREALRMSALWVSLAALFAIGFAFWRGQEEALEFVAGYVIELSLSMDNLFAITLIFAYFAVPDILQRRVLFWGIFGALVMRGLMIGVGVELVQAYHWLLSLLGLFLVFNGAKWILAGQAAVQPEKNAVVRLARRFFPVTPGFEGQNFLGMVNGRRALTPLALALVMVETTDVVFAVDSIPAIFAVTEKAFIIFTSNVFAILGLRSLYFVLASAVRQFRHLRVGLAGVLVFIGAKMLAAPWIKISTAVSLAVVGLILGSAIAFSALTARPEKP